MRCEHEVDAPAVEQTELVAHRKGIEEAALALMQMYPGGPGVPMRHEARVAVEAYLRITHPPASDERWRGVLEDGLLGIHGTDAEEACVILHKAIGEALGTQEPTG